MSFDDDTHGHFDTPPVQGKSNKTCLIVSVILGAIFLLVLCCAGGIYWSFKFGTGVLGEALETELAGNPVIEEHIGTIENIEFDIMGTGQHQQATGNDDYLVFKITGSKGSGKIVIEANQNQPGNTQPFNLDSAELQLPSGETIPLSGESSLEESLNMTPEEDLPEGDPFTIE